MMSSDGRLEGTGAAIALLTMVFAGLKLSHRIDWSWWWVFSPLWLVLIIPGAIILLEIVISFFEYVRWNP